MITVGSVIRFNYNLKPRIVKVEHIATHRKGFFNRIRFVRGWDVSVGQIGAFRSFNPDKMTDISVLG